MGDLALDVKAFVHVKIMEPVTQLLVLANVRLVGGHVIAIDHVQTGDMALDVKISAIALLQVYCHLYLEIFFISLLFLKICENHEF